MCRLLVSYELPCRVHFSLGIVTEKRLLALREDARPIDGSRVALHPNGDRTSTSPLNPGGPTQILDGLGVRRESMPCFIDFGMIAHGIHRLCNMCPDARSVFGASCANK